MNDATATSTFDADSFMNQTMDQPLETEFKLIPVGEYPAMIDDFDSSAFQKIDFEYKRGPRAGQPGSMTKFTIPFVINDDKAKAAVGRDPADKLVATKQLIVDVNEFGQLDFGVNKNVELGKIRAAVNQNQPGPWSPAQLRGAGPVMLKIEHVSYDRADGTKGQRAEVTRVVPLR